MEYEIRHRPGSAVVQIDLLRGESIEAEPGALVGISENVVAETTTDRPGVSVASRQADGEPAMRNEYTARGGRGRVTLAPPLPGDVLDRDLAEGTLWVQSAAYLASAPDVTLDADVSAGIFPEAERSVVALRGSDVAFLGGLGAIEPVAIEEGDVYAAETAHVVAWEESLHVRVRGVDGLKPSRAGRETQVCEFRGEGTAWVQARTPGDMLAHLLPLVDSLDYDLD